MASHPTFGVEEEFLLVDPDSGEPVARNATVARRAKERGVDLQLELTSCQVETATEVVDTSEQLRDELTRLRRIAADAAEADGARLLAVALPPTVPHEFPITDKPRYRKIAERFGMIAHEQGISGCHVHVAVPDREVGDGRGRRDEEDVLAFLHAGGVVAEDLHDADTRELVINLDVHGHLVEREDGGVGLLRAGRDEHARLRTSRHGCEQQRQQRGQPPRHIPNPHASA